MHNSLSQERSAKLGQKTRSSHFPPKINNALALLAGRVGECGQLSRDARILLCEYVRVLDKNDAYKACRVSNAELQRALELSVRTICRLKAELEHAGWITRHQIQSRELGMQITDVSLTHKAIQALSLAASASSSDDTVSWELRVPASLSYLLDIMSSKEVIALMSLCKKLKITLQDFLFDVSAGNTKIKKHFAYYRSILLRRLNSKIPDPALTTSSSSTTATKGSNAKNQSQERFNEVLNMFNGKRSIVCTNNLKTFTIDAQTSSLLVEEVGKYALRVIDVKHMKSLLLNHCF